VPDTPDPQPTNPKRPRRTRKFVLPDHHHDERDDGRTAEHIEAFLDGRPAKARRAVAVEAHVRRPIELDTRPDWMAAFRHESARHIRYGRPASVVLIGLHGSAPAEVNDRVARAIGDAIRAEARETDRAVRIDARTFRVLLPETGARAARTLVERLGRAVRTGANGSADQVDVRFEVATASRNGTLEQAVADGEARLAGTDSTGA
jgi:GGDEF domain-containing protein